MDVGAHLRSAREQRRLSIEHIASSTKLPMAVLLRIERNEWEHLPRGFLTRGHLRAYAAAVGVDPSPVVEAYSKQWPAHVEPPTAPAVEVESGSGLRPVVLAVLGLALSISVYRWLNDSPTAPPSSATSAVQRPAAEEPAPGLSTAPDPVPAVDARVAGLSLQVDATGPCWIAVKADGRTVIYRLLEAGESETVAANDELVLRIGDPGNFRYTLNGVQGRTLGDGRQPVTVTITSDNVRSFLTDSTPAARLPR